jgi:hypothetical protein
MYLELNSGVSQITYGLGGDVTEIFRLRFLPTLAAVVVIAACARRTAVTLAPGAKLLPGASITVVRPSQDPANVQTQLERLLLARGFQVISDAAGGTRLEAEARTSGDTSGRTTTASIGTVQRVRSDYALRYSYRTRMGLGTGDVFETFTATIIDLRTGAVVAAADFSQGGLTGKQVGTVLSEFVDQLLQR